ncbi:MAG: response regulator [Acidobacteria bacterium]|nr:response regulator [Acidobacteriota bacterium]MBI3657923.1 response regulator [Acidobacteriota bacterium]
MKHKVLFVDDEPHVTEALKRTLRKEPYEFLSACLPSAALELLAQNAVDVVVSDEMMPGMSGSEFLAEVRQKYPDTIRIILTGQATLNAAIIAINKGEIYRFLTKPCNDVDLAATIRQALAQKELLAESRRLLQTVKQQSSVLEELEKEYPGVTQVDRDASGAVIIEDSPTDLDSLLKEIDATVRKCNAHFHDPMDQEE